MGKCFMHINKIKGSTAMNAAYKHNYRTDYSYAQNADPNLALQNDELVSLNGLTYEQAFEKRMKELGYGENLKMRKNAVQLLDVVVSFSREDLGKFDLEEWKKENVTWLREAFNANPLTFGDNVLSVIYHGDEAGNVHCHAMVIPIDKGGKLSAFYYMDGREQLTALQSQYASRMEKFGLERGIERSVAKHEDIKRFYGELNQVMNTQVPEYTLKDTPQSYRQKVIEFTKDREAVYFRKMKEKDVEITELKSLQKNEIHALKKQHSERLREIHKLKKEKEDFVREYGPTMGDVKKSLQAMADLKDALKEDPDRERMAELTQSINQLLHDQRKRRREKNRNEIKPDWEH